MSKHVEYTGSINIFLTDDGKIHTEPPRQENVMCKWTAAGYKIIDDFDEFTDGVPDWLYEQFDIVRGGIVCRAAPVR